MRTIKEELYQTLYQEIDVFIPLKKETYQRIDPAATPLVERVPPVNTSTTNNDTPYTNPGVCIYSRLRV